VKYGKVTVLTCHGCLRTMGVYQGTEPIGWVKVKGFWFCRRCVKKSKGYA
jgi:hypothetical protein